MNEKFNKINTILKNQLNVKIVSVYTCKSLCIFILCVDMNGLFFMVNVRAYKIFIDDEFALKTIVMKLLDNSEISSIYATMKYYEQFLSFLPKFRDKLVYFVDDYLIINSNNVYKILKDSSSNAGLYRALTKFPLDYLYDNKFNFSSEIYAFNDDLLKKVKDISSTALSEKLSSQKFPRYFSNVYEIIMAKHNELQNLQDLFQSIYSFLSKLKKDLKLLDDYTSDSRINLYDTNKNIHQKTKIKQKMKNMEKIKEEVTENMTSIFCHLMHKIVLYIFYKNELDKKYITIESTYSDFVEKFN